MEKPTQKIQLSGTTITTTEMTSGVISRGSGERSPFVESLVHLGGGLASQRLLH